MQHRKLVFTLLCLTLLASLLFLTFNIQSTEILYLIRIPELLVILSAGGVLSVSGATFQKIFNNSLTDPYILGISAGAGLGTVIGYSFNINPHITALIGSLFTISLIFFAGTFLKDKLSIILFGVGINALFSSLIVFSLAVTAQTQLPSTLFFLLGFIPVLTLKKSAFLFMLSLITLVFLLLKNKTIDLLSLNDTLSYFSGIEPSKERIFLILTISLALSFIISETGIIGFVGLVVPNIGKALNIRKAKELLLFSYFTGGLFLLLSKSIVKFTLNGYDIPSGTIAAVIGAPIFLFILWKERKNVIY